MKKLIMLGCLATALVSSCQNNPDKEEKLSADTLATSPVAVQTAPDTSGNVYDFVAVDKQPGFPGGMDKFYAYLNKTVVYPKAAIETSTQGKVFLSFIVEKDGSLNDIKVDKTLGNGTDEEAIRVLKASPKWNPGEIDGQPVKVKYNIPISFTLTK